MKKKKIVFAIFPGFQMIDLTGPHEVFSQSIRLGAEISLETVAASTAPVGASSGLFVLPTKSIEEIDEEIDTLIAVGGDGVHEACENEEFVDWFSRAAHRSRRVAAVCSGAFLLGAAGFLDGKRSVTHWAFCSLLSEKYPATTVDPHPIFIKDGNVWTSAGITAGLDLALGILEEDCGARMARDVARVMVMFVQRPAGQAQFSVQLEAQRPDRLPIREAVEWISQNPAGDLSVSAMASRAAMSDRNFTRVFRAETGLTLAKYVERSRVEAAKRMLASTMATLNEVAKSCGFSTVETLHRSFRRVADATPGEYRRANQVPQYLEVK
ncbi:GlxA family transcriptional regulator [Streptomyces sp. NPDC096934]|uniref:GlxA family transcriptional regulator n=1 Tax=Streptomyces sp. NPDC096934 TaxID=3155551 RepID=UPI00331FB2BD